MSNLSLKTLFRTKNLDQAIHDALEIESDGHSSGLERSLTVWDLTSFGIAAIIGAGIFSTIGSAAYSGGPAVVWLFIITAAVCGLSALCYAEFASKIPVAGSAYTYAYISLGELVAWIIGWDLIMEYAIGNIAVAISWSGYFGALLEGYGIKIPEYLMTDYVSASRAYHQVMDLVHQGTQLDEALKQLGATVAQGYQAFESAPYVLGMPFVCNLPALGIVTFLTYVAYLGIKESKWTSNLMVALKVIVILVVIGVGAFFIKPINWVPFAPNGITGIFKGVSAVFFAYIGFDAISTTAEECKDPQRDLPRGMIYALIGCTILYVMIALIVTGIVSYKELQVGDPLAFVFGPEGANLPWVSALVAASAVVAMASVILVFQIGQPRIWMAMSRDGLLPKIFAAIHPKYHTPWFSTILTGVIVAVPALFMNMTEVTDLTSIGTLFAFMLVCGGVIKLHEDRKREAKVSRAEGRKTFQVPIISSRVWAPVVLIASLLVAWYFNREGMTSYFDLTPTATDTTTWDVFKHKIPLLAYALGMVYLVFECVRKDLSLIPVLGLASTGYLITELGWLNWARFILWLAAGLVIYFSYSRYRSRLNEQA